MPVFIRISIKTHEDRPSVAKAQLNKTRADIKTGNLENQQKYAMYYYFDLNYLVLKSFELHFNCFFFTDY